MRHSHDAIWWHENDILEFSVCHLHQTQCTCLYLCQLFYKINRVRITFHIFCNYRPPSATFCRYSIRMPHSLEYEERRNTTNKFSVRAAFEPTTFRLPVNTLSNRRPGGSVSPALPIPILKVKLGLFNCDPIVLICTAIIFNCAHPQPPRHIWGWGLAQLKIIVASQLSTMGAQLNKPNLNFNFRMGRGDWEDTALPGTEISVSYRNRRKLTNSTCAGNSFFVYLLSPYSNYPFFERACQKFSDFQMTACNNRDQMDGESFFFLLFQHDQHGRVVIWEASSLHAKSAIWGAWWLQKIGNVIQ